MTKDVISKHINQLTSKDKIDEALKVLLDYVRNHDKDIEDTLIIQQGSFSRNKQDYGRGLISRDEYTRTLARIRYVIVQILGDLPNNGNDVDGIDHQQTVEQPNNQTKILFLTASPETLVRIRVDKEYRKVKDELERSTERERFDIKNEPAVTISNITSALQKYTPQIIHFSGHGSGEEGLFVEGPNGGTQKFPVSGLNRLFKLNKIRNAAKCVVLNACYSKSQAKIISEHGIYVVGMNKAIVDEAAIGFSVGFYQGLGEGNSYEDAFEVGMTIISAYTNNANTPELWLNGKIIE